MKETRESKNTKCRFFYLAQEHLLIITIPTRKHEKAHSHIYDDIAHSIRQMGLRKSWSMVHSTTLSSNHDGSSREGDSAGGPLPDRMADDAWPTLVVEAGASQSLPDLRNTIRWWFSASDHAVKIVLLVKIYTHLRQIVIEKWTEGSPVTNSSRATRSAMTISPINRQIITIDMLPIAAAAPSNDPIRANPESYTVTRGDLHLEFELLFLRQPNAGEGDIVITTAMFQDLGALLWYH